MSLGLIISNRRQQQVRVIAIWLNAWRAHSDGKHNDACMD